MFKVLLVEDSETMRSLIAAALDELADCELMAVANGLEALRALTQHSFALIITDINMPTLNGLELLRFIRSAPGTQATPVLMVTSEGADADRQRAMALGATAYLAKPFTPAALCQCVQALRVAPA